ncbi:MAG: outer membrane beta-barrel protein [Bacteroidetes bacterium]|nr:outer membrane beta-barrel protein [Bacteroidota bacterium]
MKKHFFLYILFFLILLPSLSFAQRWKKKPYELVYGLGFTNFNGDVGSPENKGIGKYYWFHLASTRPVFFVGGRYYFLDRLSVRLNFMYGIIVADDHENGAAWTGRNLNFKSSIIEASSQIEFSIVKEKRKRNIFYNIRGSRSILSNINIPTYLFVGVGGFYFNPKGKYKGEWYHLQPFGTEGQGLPGGDKKYNRIALTIPFGIGFKYKIADYTYLGFEAGYRFTFTDYIDDVGGKYYDTQEILNAYGEEAAALSFRSHTLDNIKPGYTSGGSTKGGEFIDTYQFFLFNISRKLKTGRRGLPKFTPAF